MSEAGDRITGRVEGDVSGQVAIGKNLRQEQYDHSSRLKITERDRAEAEALFEELRAQVSEQSPDGKRAAALERVNELKQAVTAEKPRLSTVEYVRDWFVDHLPKLAGAVTSVVLSPIVGKLVTAGGDMAAAELRRRLG